MEYPANGFSNLPEPMLKPIKPWYKERGAKIFISFLLFLLVIGLAFALLVGYYVWQIRYRGLTAADIRPTVYRGQQSTDTKSAGQSGSNTPTDIRQFVRSYNPSLGSVQAPLTIVAFIDFECPYCQAGYATFNTVMEQYGPAAHIVFKHFPISAIHPSSIQAGLAATCAKEQEQFWEYYHILFQQKKLDEAALIGYAEDLGLNADKFTKCLRQQKYSHEIEDDLADVATLGLRGTPTYFVNQTKIEGLIDLATWQTIIANELRKSAN